MVSSDWIEYKCKSGETIFLYNKETGVHKWPPGYNDGSSEDRIIFGQPVEVKELHSIATQTDDYGCNNGCTSTFIDTGPSHQIPEHLKVVLKYEHNQNSNFDSNDMQDDNLDKRKEQDVESSLKDDDNFGSIDNDDVDHDNSNELDFNSECMLDIDFDNENEQDKQDAYSTFHNNVTDDDVDGVDDDSFYRICEQQYSPEHDDAEDDLNSENKPENDFHSEQNRHNTDSTIHNNAADDDDGGGDDDDLSNEHTCKQDDIFDKYNRPEGHDVASTLNHGVEPDNEGNACDDYLCNYGNGNDVGRGSKEGQQINKQAKHSDQPQEVLHLRCNICFKEFESKSQLQCHLRSIKHKEEKPFECSYCKKTYSYYKCFETHLKLHTEIQPLKCNHCEKRFARMSELNVHIRTHAVEKKHFKCRFCQRMFAIKRFMQKHILKVHLNETSHAVNQCPKKCSRKENPKPHPQPHTGEKLLECSYCEKKFQKKTNLKIHLRTHTGERPYKCSYCPKRFAQHCACRRHEKTHTGEKPFQCSCCRKTFTRKDNMLTHLLGCKEK